VNDPESLEARRAAEGAARTSYGRLIAMLSARTRDIGAAEDALAEAFAAALQAWPARGIPDKPDAWLLTAARRNLLHRLRRHRVEQNAVTELLLRADERRELTEENVDRRLELLFVCAHPALDESVRTPLMLQTVLGIGAERIASAFLVAPSTMSQRLVRAKAKIKQAAPRFAVPEAQELPARLDDVLRAVYVAYGAGWEDLERGRGLTEEAIFLGRTLVGLLPEEPEAKGLLALMLHCEARREARRDPQGRFVPLPRQDPSLWARASIVEAEALLTAAASAGRFGRFQCEAAIQSVHAQRAITGTINYAALRALYDLLLDRAPSIGVAVGRAAMLLEAGDVEAATVALGALDESELVDYQPYWVTRARRAELCHDAPALRRALERALGLTEDAAVRRFLADWLERSAP
jgi:RNA polymerase sigma-70 factor, ECF subfamily